MSTWKLLDNDTSVSDYEKIRLKNIKENSKFFASLGIFKAKEQLVGINGPKKITKPKPREKRKLLDQNQFGCFYNVNNPYLFISQCNREKKVVIPRKLTDERKESCYTQEAVIEVRRQGPDGKPLPPKPVIRYIDEVTKREERKPTGPLQMLPTKLYESSKENLPIQVSETLRDIVSNSPNYDSTKHTQSQPALQTFCRAFAKMKIMPDRVAKVTRERVYSVAIHPSQDKVVVCAGDRGGRLGIWDVESQNKETSGIMLFEPHSSPINCLHFAPANPSKILSTSYDGTVRCGDLERGVFDEAYATTPGLDIYISHFDFLSPDGSQLIVAQNNGEGHVAIVDTRTRCGAESVHRLHDKSIRTVSVHPLKKNCIVTGSKDGTVALWDTRSLKTKGKKNKSITTLNQGRGVTGAYFSPLTGRKLLTTSHNDTLKVYTFADNGAVFLKTTVRHNNFVGRWLTSFRAVWHPSREDVFISGSMERPRRIEVFDDKGVLLKNFMDEDCLGSVCSINAFHPTRNILVGGNSSGRLHVFM
ncbi:WD repeat-containing protein 76-like [Amphiura filiformis]|uniref:WD repeat-containing protein 76-like n=1 Tax=Amphiura filiformis TaxID=82378 RepID=UPI003B213AE5